MEATLAIYEFKCKGCKATVEAIRPDEDRLPPCKECGGVMRRNWSSVSLLRENIRAVKRGG